MPSRAARGRRCGEIAGILAAACLVAGSAAADPVRDNLRFTLYHAVGHAVIDQMRVPMLGSEETAADGFALVLADRLHDEAEMAEMIASLTALARMQAVAAIDPWSLYMADGQRIAWRICLWFGLEPAARGDLARALGLPREAHHSCTTEARRLRAGSAPILARAEPGMRAKPRLVPKGGGKALTILADDVLRLQCKVALPQPTPVTQESCGEDNAFYYHEQDRIVICDKLVEALQAAVLP